MRRFKHKLLFLGGMTLLLAAGATRALSAEEAESVQQENPEFGFKSVQWVLQYQGVLVDEKTRRRLQRGSFKTPFALNLQAVTSHISHTSAACYALLNTSSERWMTLDANGNQLARRILASYSNSPLMVIRGTASGNQIAVQSMEPRPYLLIGIANK